MKKPTIAAQYVRSDEELGKMVYKHTEGVDPLPIKPTKRWTGILFDCGQTKFRPTDTNDVQYRDVIVMPTDDFEAMKDGSEFSGKKYRLWGDPSGFGEDLTATIKAQTFFDFSAEMVNKVIYINGVAQLDENGLPKRQKDEKPKWHVNERSFDAD